MPADNTITGIAKTNSNLTILVQALVKADLGGTLQGTGPFSVFAPTVAAFTTFLKTTPYATINDVPKEALTQILLNHVVSGNILAASLTEGQMVGTLQTPQKFTIQLAGGAKIKDVSNRISTIVATDVQCSNGVIHVLNKVLLPTL